MAESLNAKAKRIALEQVEKGADSDKMMRFLRVFDQVGRSRRPTKAKAEAPAEPPKPKQDTSFMD